MVGGGQRQGGRETRREVIVTIVEKVTQTRVGAVEIFETVRF